MRTMLGVALCLLAFRADAQDRTIPYELRAFRECEYFRAFLLLGAEITLQEFRDTVERSCARELEADPSINLSVDRAIDAFMPGYERILQKHKETWRRTAD